MQYDLNKSQAGFDFDPEVRYPQILNTLFVSMWFGGGMPIVILLAAVAFLITYYLDKLLILKFYNKRKAEMLDGSIVRFATKLLPIAIIFHLTVTIYIYGSNDVMYDLRWGSGMVMSTNIASISNITGAAYATFEKFKTDIEPYDFFDLLPRVTRLNTIFLVIALVLIILMVLLKGIIEPAVVQLLGTLGVVKPYEPSPAAEEDADETKKKVQLWTHAFVSCPFLKM